MSKQLNNKYGRQIWMQKSMLLYLRSARFVTVFYYTREKVGLWPLPAGRQGEQKVSV